MTYKPMRIIVRMPNWLGDCVMALPAIIAIKKHLPEAQVDILIKESFAGLARLTDEIDYAVPLPVDKLHHDIALILPGSFRSAWEMWKAGPPERIGYAGEMRSMLLSNALPRPAKHSMHQAKNFNQLAKAAFPDIVIDELKLTAPLDAIDRANELITKSDKPIVGIGFGASYGSAKMWPAERFAELIDLLSEKVDVVLLGAKSDKEVEAKVIGLTKSNPVSLVGQTDIPTLAAIFQKLGLYITNDTGPMHLASAMGTKVIGIFGPTSPEETKPLAKNATVIYSKADCAPCWQRQCPTDHRCMNAIDVENVLKVSLETIDQRFTR